MCELMGLSFARPIPADFAMREFALRGRENADGWGLAWYPDRSLALVKEPVAWHASTYTGFLESYHRLLSPVYVAHVRERSVGGPPTHADTQPFAREWGGRDYCFAHNGTIKAFRDLPLGRYRPVGDTDSEHLFCHLLDDADRQSVDLAAEPGWRWLHGRLASLNRLGSLNCLLTDGVRLFAYHDAGGHKGLTFCKVFVRGAARHFEDEELRIDLKEESVNHGFVVASCPLSRAGWQPFHRGELIVLEGGLVRFSSHRGTPA
jgi:glutamine amidotransferase